ncbi:MAG: hypothetical protein ACRD8A_05135 [Candidatus Acidiferrales bacterium]
MVLPLANGKYHNHGRRGATVLAFSALAIWFFHFYLWYQYDGSLPIRPDASTGRVYALNTHGHCVYLTKTEDFRLWGLAFVTSILFIVAIIVNGLFVEGFSRTKMPWEKKQW